MLAPLFGKYSDIETVVLKDRRTVYWKFTGI